MTVCIYKYKDFAPLDEAKVKIKFICLKLFKVMHTEKEKLWSIFELLLITLMPST